MGPVFTLSDYAISVGTLSTAQSEWIKEQGYTRIFILADTHTQQHCLPYFLECTGLANDVPVAIIPAGELHKHIGTCQQVWQAMFDAQLDRRALVINIGGGVIGDLGGFCAATFKRGVDFVQVPTTLLSMTDAAIGGKLGVDFQSVKNAIGVFRNPAAVWVDAHFLQTLPARELRSGFAEVVKHALLGDPVLWQALQSLQRIEDADWNSVLPASIAVKVRVVQEDPLEKGLRAILNYGHTIGHALESYFLDSPAALTHGEAVAAGMVAESKLAYGNTAKLIEVQQYIERFFPKVPVTAQIFPTLWALMQQDKKNVGDSVRMAVPGHAPFTLQTLSLQESDLTRALL